jgi:CDP-paratose 2-epimerase
MEYKTILITGGCGFVGSNIALSLKRDFPELKIIALDNLSRKGSELNVPRLAKNGIDFFKKDVRFKDSFDFPEKIDLVIDCAAEPSVMAGLNGSPQYVLDTNLQGTLNCIELARKDNSDFIFLSTSRVYPISELSSLNYNESDARFVLSDNQELPGVSSIGVSEDFPIGKVRTLYGATKLASELIINEYVNNYGLRAVINRCGVIAGPWQFGKVDQGIVALWISRHIYDAGNLSYIGYGGTGKQVRDILHIDDLYSAIKIQIMDISNYSGETFNLGGGLANSVSLLGLTNFSRKISGNSIEIESDAETRVGDIPIYITNYNRFSQKSGWKPSKSVEDILMDVYNWIKGNQEMLKDIFI